MKIVMYGLSDTDLCQILSEYLRRKVKSAVLIQNYKVKLIGQTILEYFVPDEKKKNRLGGIWQNFFPT